MKIIDCKQNSPEWLAARLGKVTASEIDALVSPKGKIREGAGVETYLYKKLAEKLLGYSLNDWGSQAAEHGSIMETEARPWYAFDREVEVREVGFCTDDSGRIGFSPDGLVGEDGGVEIKCFQPQNSLRVLVEGRIPDENLMQVHFSLFVSGRKWWDWVSYSRQWPPFVTRVYRDEKIIATFKEALEYYHNRFDAALAKIKAMKDAENAEKTEAYYASQPESDK